MAHIPILIVWPPSFISLCEIQERLIFNCAFIQNDGVECLFQFLIVELFLNWSRKMALKGRIRIYLSQIHFIGIEAIDIDIFGNSFHL